MEVLVVLALVGMLAGSVIGFLWDLWGRRDVLLRDSTDAQAGSAIVERIETDILSGLAGDQSAGAGVAGTATTLRLLTRGVDVPMGGNGTTSGDLQASEYRFDAGALRARRWNIGAGGNAEFETVCDHVEAVRVRYFDGREWKTSFDSLSAGALPVAVEVAIWFGTPHVEDERATKPVARTEAGAGARDNAVEDPEQERASAAGRASTTGSTLPSRQPDRLRVIVVPDGPVAAWKDTR